MNQTKVLFTLILGGLLATATTAKASSPDTWEKHYQQVNASCLNVSNLQNVQPVGSIFSFDDEVGYDALLIRGNYSQPYMNNQVGQFLCLFNRRTRQAYVSEVKQLQQSPNKTLSGLPGQTIEQVRQWASKHSFLPPLQSVEKLEQGYPDYTSVINLGQKAGLSASYIAFKVFTDSDGIVTSQTIDYRDYSSIRPPLAFTPSHSQGLQLIQTIYDKQIKNDFMQSKFLKHKDVGGSNQPKVNVYVGKLFVYQTWNSKDSSAQFSISRLEDLNHAKQIPAQNFNDGLNILLKASLVSEQEKYAQPNTTVPYCRGLELLNQAHNVIDVSWRTLPEAQEKGTIELAKAAQKMGIQPTSSYNGISRWDSLENCQNNN